MRRGFDLSDAVCHRSHRRGRAVVVDAEALDRIELRLGPGEGTLTGYMRVGTELGPLPIGSQLDDATGTFGWQPGVGFVGRSSRLVRAKDGRVTERQEVTITLHAKGSRDRGPGSTDANVLKRS